MTPKGAPHFDNTFLLAVSDGKRMRRRKNEVVFSQGDPADALFYLQEGRIRITVSSAEGKEAVIAILGAGTFFGEGCLAGQALRMSTATTVGACLILRLEKTRVVRLLHEDPGFAEIFLKYVLTRNVRIEEDLVDQLFNSSERRLARVLLLLANYGNEREPERAVAKISQKTLAEMIGTTRSRVSFFMNRFRKLGFIEYNGELKVHDSLLTIVLHD